MSDRQGRAATTTRLDCTLVDHPAVAVREVGLTIAGPYLERCWCHVVGPTGVVLVRTVGWLAKDKSPCAVEVSELAEQLGIGGTGVNAPIWRALARLSRWGLVEWTEGELIIYEQVAPLSPRQVPRAPASAREAHAEMLHRVPRWSGG